MSREYQQFLDGMHDDIAHRFTRGGDGVKRHVECRIADKIYVYLYEDGAHIQTQTVEIPAGWQRRWPSDGQVRFFVRQRLNLGKARITSLTA
jgi:hypothetical protein